MFVKGALSDPPPAAVVVLPCLEVVPSGVKIVDVLIPVGLELASPLATEEYSVLEVRDVEELNLVEDEPVLNGCVFVDVDTIIAPCELVVVNVEPAPFVIVAMMGIIVPTPDMEELLLARLEVSVIPK